jgi:hypothetical protein
MLWLSDAQGGKAAAPGGGEGHLAAANITFSAVSWPRQGVWFGSWVASMDGWVCVIVVASRFLAGRLWNRTYWTYSSGSCYVRGSWGVNRKSGSTASL